MRHRILPYARAGGKNTKKKKERKKKKKKSRLGERKSLLLRRYKRLCKKTLRLSSKDDDQGKCFERPTSRGKEKSGSDKVGMFDFQGSVGKISNSCLLDSGGGPGGFSSSVKKGDREKVGLGGHGSTSQ